MPTSTLTTKGQITIPRQIRAALNLRTGDQLVFHLRDDGVVEMQPEKVDLMSLFGALDPPVKGVTLEDMEAAIEAEATSR
jgi:AbrB family looped-hinge helix DNA binding protein